MAKEMGIYKCEICGNIVEVLHEGKGELVCCGQPMQLYEANTVEAAYEKHIPVIERTQDGILVKVGSVAHPMIPEHYIEWVEVIFANRVCRHNFKPEDKPEAFFAVTDEKFQVRAYCNLHGLWKAE